MTTTAHTQKNDRHAAGKPGGHSRRSAYVTATFAAIGVAWIALSAVAVVGWISSGQSVPNRSGADQVSGYIEVFAVVAQPALVLGMLWAIWRYLVRTWLRERRLTFDGMLVIAMALLVFQDPLSNYVRPYFTYNTAWFNLGSWTAHLPGWQSANSHLLAMPILTFTVPSYVFGTLGGVVVGCTLMTQLHNRFPHLAMPARIGILYVAFVAADVVLEPILLTGGIYAFPHAPEELTLYYGHYFQYPITEGVTWGAVWTILTCLRYFRDEHGRTFVERGVDRLKLGTRASTIVAILAVIGISQTAFTVCFNIPNTLTTLHNRPVPADILNRPYLNNGVLEKR